MTEAEEAARLFAATDPRPVAERENAVYRVTCRGRPTALRLHRRGYQGAAAIRSELWWCGALAAAGLPVPAPLRAEDGEVVVTLASGRMASCVDWLPGAALGAAGVPLAGPPAAQVQAHHALGALLARLHAATDALDLPAGFTRPAWDIAGLVGPAPLWGRFWEHPALTPDQAATLRAARDHLAAGLAALAPGWDFGLIHADVLRENVLVDGDRLALIDFDDAGFGPRGHDLGTVLSQNLYEPAFPDIRAALLEGYAPRRRVSEDEADLFTLMRCCASVGWAAPRLPPGHPVHASHIARAVMWARRVMG
ncbi:MAG: phosphotransferase [Rhodobacterales bacterium]|nr:phosphotransferase [Rhodobacterales bacterium]